MSSVSAPYCPNCRAPTSRQGSAWTCPTCDWTLAVAPPTVVHREKKAYGDRQTKLLHVLITPVDFVRVLEQAGGGSISEYCREAIRQRLDRDEADGRVVETTDGVGGVAARYPTPGTEPP